MTGLPDEPAGRGPAADVSRASAANAEFYESFEATDLDRMRAVWDDADDVVCIHPGWDEILGISRVMRSWALIFANTGYIQFFLTGIDVHVDGDVAVVRCVENMMTAPGDATGDARAIATNVFRRRDDEWRLWLHHASPVLSARADDE